MADEPRPDARARSLARAEERALAPSQGAVDLPWATTVPDWLDDVVTVTVQVPSDRDDAEDLRRGVAGLAGVSHPHLALLREAVDHGQSLALRFRVPPGSRPLATVLDTRSLTPGQVVTLGVPWAQAMAALHAARLVAAGANVSDVVVDPSGRPLVLPGRVRAVGRHDERDDVVALVRLLRSLLDDAMPGILAMVLLRACGDSREDRPAAGALASALLAATAPQPLPLPATSGVASEQSAGGGRRAGAGDVAAPAEPARGREPSPQEPAGPGPAAPELAAEVRRLADRDGPGVAPERRRRGPTGSAGPGLHRPGLTRRRVTRVAAVGLGLAGLAVVAVPMVLPASGDRAAADGAVTGGTAVTEHGTVSGNGAVTGGTAVTEHGMVSGNGAVTGGGTSAPVPPAASATPSAPASPARTGSSPVHWPTVMGELDRRRSAAFAAGDQRALLDVDRPASAALADDLAVLRSFVAAGVRPDGFALDLVSVREIRREGGTATLQVVDRRRPYRVVDEGGAVVESRPARGEATWKVVLMADAAGEWRVSSVTPASA